MYICCHRAGKAKDLYSRSFLLDEKTSRKDERAAGERQNGERAGERQREVVSGELGEDCHESSKRKERMTGTKRGKGGERGERAEEDGRGGRRREGEGRSAALGERAG